MAYEKLNLADGTVLKSEHLAHMEEGIAQAVSVAAQTLTKEQKAQARANLGVDEYINEVFLGGEW